MQWRYIDTIASGIGGRTFGPSPVSCIPPSFAPHRRRQASILKTLKTRGSQIYYLRVDERPLLTLEEWQR